MKSLLSGLFTLLFILSNYAQYPSYFSYNIENGAPSNEIYSILQDKDGYIWIGCDAGVYRFNGVQYEHFTNEELEARSATGLLQTTSGKIYGYNFKGQIFYINSKGLHVVKGWNGPVNSLTEDNNGNIWLASQIGNYIINDRTLDINRHDSKVVKFNTNGQAFTGNIRRNEAGKLYYHNETLLIERDLNGNESSTYIDPCFQFAPILISHSQNEPWLFSLTENKIFKKENGKWISYTDPRLINLLKDRKPNDVKQIDEDLWINTHTGIIRFSLKDGFAELFYPNIAFSGCIKDNENNYWFSTLHHGLLKFPNIEIRTWNRVTGINEIEQLSHVTFSDKTIVACGTAGELLEIDRSNNTFSILRHDPQSDIGMCYFDPFDDCFYFNKLSYIYRLKSGTISRLNNSSRAVKAMLHNRQGYLFLSSQGLYFTENINKNLEFDDLIADGWYREICESPFGKGYFVAGNDGLMKLDLKQDNKWSISKNFLSKQVLSLSADPKNKKVYFLTFDGEIYFIDQFGRCQLFDKNLVDFRASKLTVYKGSLFLATIKGILKIDLKTHQKIVLNNKNGLSSNNIRHLEIRNDTCWAASGKGMMSIPLSCFNMRNIQGRIHDRGVKLNGIQYSSKKIPTVQFDDIITILVDGISYSSNGEFQLAYQILGHSENWIRVPGSLGKLEIPRLPSGELTLVVKMIDDKGVDSSNILRYKLNVLPPFWQRWWFYVLIILLVAGSAFLIFRSRLIKLRKKQQQALKELRLENELRLTQQNALKAQMNPHFLFNVLNSIKGYIYENDKKNAARYLSDFSSLVRKVLDLSSLPSVSLDQELEALKLYIDLEAMLLQSDFEYTIEVDDNVDLSGIQIPALLIQPYVENAFKHGLRHKMGSKRLTLNISLDESTGILTVEINDNGIGRKAAEELNSVNRGDHQSFATSAMEKRLELLNHERNDIVGVEITDKFEGEVAVGTTVTVRIHV